MATSILYHTDADPSLYDDLMKDFLHSLKERKASEEDLGSVAETILQQVRWRGLPLPWEVTRGEVCCGCTLVCALVPVCMLKAVAPQMFWRGGSLVQHGTAKRRGRHWFMQAAILVVLTHLTQSHVVTHTPLPHWLAHFLYYYNGLQSGCCEHHSTHESPLSFDLTSLVNNYDVTHFQAWRYYFEKHVQMRSEVRDELWDDWSSQQPFCKPLSHHATVLSPYVIASPYDTFWHHPPTLNELCWSLSPVPGEEHVQELNRSWVIKCWMLWLCSSEPLELPWQRISMVCYFIFTIPTLLSIRSGYI